MDHIHFETDASPRDTFAITIDRSANVLLMDDASYQNYCAQQSHDCFGGPAAKGLTILKPNRKARWHIVVDLGKFGGAVTASVVNKATGQPVGPPQTKTLQKT